MLVHHEELGDRASGLHRRLPGVDGPGARTAQGDLPGRADHLAPAGPAGRDLVAVARRLDPVRRSDPEPTRAAHDVSDDRIELRGLRVLARCGVLPDERAPRQPLEVDLDLEVDLSVAGASDSLDDTVDYGARVVERVVAACDGHHQLLERLADRIALAASADDRVRVVTVTVRKLRPPVPHDLATAGVRVRRARA